MAWLVPKTQAQLSGPRWFSAAALLSEENPDVSIDHGGKQPAFNGIGTGQSAPNKPGTRPSGKGSSAPTPPPVSSPVLGSGFGKGVGDPVTRPPPPPVPSPGEVVRGCRERADEADVSSPEKILLEARIAGTEAAGSDHPHVPVEPRLLEADFLVFNEPELWNSEMMWLQSGVEKPSPGPEHARRQRAKRLFRKKAARWAWRTSFVPDEHASWGDGKGEFQHRRATASRSRVRATARLPRPLVAMYRGLCQPRSVAPVSSPTAPSDRHRRVSEVEPRPAAPRNDPHVGRNRGFVRSVIYRREKTFSFRDSKRRQMSERPGGALPQLVFMTSRRAHNKLMHSINGNTAAAPASPVPTEYPTPTEACGDMGVLGMLVGGMRRPGEHASVFSELARQALHLGREVRDDEVEFQIPGSTEYMAVVLRPEMLSPHGHAALPAQAPLVALIDCSLGIERVAYAMEYIAGLTRHQWPCTAVLCHVGSAPFAWVEIERMGRSLATRGIPVLACDARPPSWAIIRAGWRAFSSPVRTPPWLSDAPSADEIAAGAAPPLDRPLVAVTGLAHRRLVVNDTVDPEPPRVCVTEHSTSWDIEVSGLEHCRGVWIAPGATMQDLEVAVERHLGVVNRWRFSLDGHALQPDYALVGCLGRTLRASHRTRGGAPKSVGRDSASAFDGAGAAASSSLAPPAARAAREGAPMEVDSIALADLRFAGQYTTGAASSHEAAPPGGEFSVSPPAGRPPPPRDTSAPAYPPHLADDVMERIPVPADGLCLYHTVTAARDAMQWLRTHDRNGVARHADQHRRDLATARGLRDRLIALLEKEGRAEDAKRLAGAGREAYPGWDDVPALAQLLRGQIVVHVGEAAFPIGQGPLLMQILHYNRADGQGDLAPHWELVQSWMQIPDVNNPTQLEEPAIAPVTVPDEESLLYGLYPEETAADLASAIADLPPLDVEGGEEKPAAAASQEISSSYGETSLWAVELVPDRLELPGARKSGGCFAKMWSDAQAVCATLSIAEHGVPLQRAKDILADTDRVRELVKTTRPGWDGFRIRLGMIALFFYNKRLRELTERDCVHILWMMSGDDLLRADRGEAQFFDVAYGCWRAYQGLVPQHVFAHLRELSHCVEGVLRGFPLSVRREDDAVLAAMHHVMGARAHEEIIHRAERNCTWDRGNRLLQRSVGGGRPAQERPEGISDRDGQDHLHAMAGALQPAGDPMNEADEDGDIEGEGHGAWHILTAKAVERTTTAIARKLERGQTIPYFTEWCKKKVVRTKGCAYRDCVLVYDRDGHIISFLTRRHPDDNIYIGIPHPLLGPTDAVLDAAMERLTSAYEATFWSIPEAFDFGRACLALAKRGHNIPYITLYWGSGGVGLSRFSAHLEAMYGEDNFKMFDPNVFFDDTELRKQMPHLTGRFIYTGQERPTNTRQRVRQDLLQKFATGEGIAGRLPYGVATHLLRVWGWKRLEMNSLLAFDDITEANLESIRRRFAVVKIRSLFFEQGTLDKQGADYAAHGMFERDPDLEDFLVSGPAAAAGLRIQHAYESTHSFEECRRYITWYARRGGDRGVGEEYIREACGLPPKARPIRRGRASAEAPQVSPVTAATPRTVAAPSHLPVRGPPTFHEIVFVELLLYGKSDFLTKSGLDNLIGRRNCVQALRSAKRTAWAAVQESSEWLSVGQRGKSEINLLPRLRLSRDCSVLYAHGIIGESYVPDERLLRNQSMTEVSPCVELLDVSSLKRYVSLSSWRVTNVRTLTDVLSEEASRLRPRRRGVMQDPPAVVQLEKRARSLSAMERAAAEMQAQALRAAANSSSAVQARKRLRTLTKSAPEASAAAIAEGDAPMLEVRVPYSFKRAWRSRRYAEEVLSSQHMDSRLQFVMLAHTVDIDMRNCMLTLMPQIVRRLAPAPEELWREQLVFLDQLAAERDQISRDILRMPIAAGKFFLNSVISGRTPDVKWKDHEFVKKLVQTSRWLRWIASSALHTVHTELRGIDAADRQPVDGASGAGWPEASALAFMWQGVEDNILAACRDFVLSKPTAHLSLHFDGVRVDRDRVRAETSSADPVGHFCELLSDYAFQRTGYRVTFVEKLHRLLIAETLASAERIEAAEVVPDELLGAGLCIPLSIARVMRNGVHVRDRLHAAGLRPGAEGDAHPALAYRDVAAALDVRLRPVLDAESLGPGVWLVHTENGGVPHCMGLVISSDEACHIFEGDRRIVIERSSFLSALRTCVDKKTVVFFGVNEVGMLPSGSLEKLLDLYAGAAPSHPTIPPAVSQPSRDQCPFDLFATDFLRDDDDGEYEVAAAGPNVSEDVAVVLPHLAQHLQEEANEYLASIAARRGDACDRCELCSFRRMGTSRHHARDRLQRHLQRYHNANASEELSLSKYVPSGRKQIGIVRAMFDQDACAGSTPGRYLHRSARHLRESVVPPLSAERNFIDKHIVLCLTGLGPVYRNKGSVISSQEYRRVGNFYYDVNFAHDLLREALRCKGRVKTMRVRLESMYQDRGSEVVLLLPRKGEQMLQLLEDIMRSPLVGRVQQSIMRACLDRREFMHLSVDATLRVAMRIRGQANYRAPAHVRAAAIVGDETAERRVLTVRGRTGAVLAMNPIRSEKTEDLRTFFLTEFSDEARSQVRFVASDNPSGAMLAGLQEAFPALECLYLDPVHLCIVYNVAFGRRSSPGQRALRRVQRKFSVTDDSLDVDRSFRVFRGAGLGMMEPAVSAARDLVLTGGMSQHRAVRLLNSMDTSRPWRSCVEYVLALAAVSAAFPEEMLKKTYKQGEQRRLDKRK